MDRTPQDTDLNDRSREIFRHIVDTYLETGEPLGSRNLAQRLSMSLSPASVRNVMSDLEHLGLIYAPHVSAGRLPTEQGLRYFVDGFMETGDLSAEERAGMDAQVGAASANRTVDTVLSEASALLSGLTRGAGLVIADKSDVRLRHIEFVRLEATRALVVMVSENGSVENRILDLPPGLDATVLTRASNYLNAHIAGRTLTEARAAIAQRLSHARDEIDSLTKALVDQGLATWAGAATDQMPQLMIHGRGNLLDNVEAREDIERLQTLFDELESREGLMQLLDLAEDGEGVRIFIGSENRLFSLSGSSVVVAPYRDGGQRIVGAVGVIGPTRLNYGRIVPVVDYTAQLVSRLMR